MFSQYPPPCNCQERGHSQPKGRPQVPVWWMFHPPSGHPIPSMKRASHCRHVLSPVPHQRLQLLVQALTQTDFCVARAAERQSINLSLSLSLPSGQRFGPKTAYVRRPKRPSWALRALSGLTSLFSWAFRARSRGVDKFVLERLVAFFGCLQSKSGKRNRVFEPGRCHRSGAQTLHVSSSASCALARCVQARSRLIRWQCPEANCQRAGVRRKALAT